jgi:GNAT superfamily N-acetyltransferase
MILPFEVVAKEDKMLKFLFVFMLANAFNYTQAISFQAENCALEARESTIIIEAMQEANEKIFFPRALQVKLLKDCPEVIPTIAQWQYDDWHTYDRSLLIESLEKSFREQLHAAALPLTIVVFKEGQPIGSISLETEGEPEFADLCDGNPWPGSFHVIPSERNKGIGTELGKLAITIAKRLGYQHFNFFTSKIQNVALYCAQGAYVVETRRFRDHEVTLLRFELN